MSGRIPMRHRGMLRVSLLAIATSLASLAPSVWSDTTADEQPDFKKRLYLGIGLGASTLEPNPREADILTVGDDSDVGFHLSFGYDINRWLSAEVYLADLGEADIDRIDTGNEQVGLDSIDYLIADVAVLGYLFNSRSGLTRTDTQDGVFCREALSLYGRLGLGAMRNEDRNSMVTHGRNYRRHVSVGLGLEYGFRNGVGIRGEWTSFDSDARYANIALVKRFGDSTCQQPVRKKVNTIPDNKTSVPKKEISKTPLVPVKKVRNPIVVPTSHFDFDVSTPDASSLNLLSLFAEQIKTIPGTLHLTGHTDSSGSNNYNDQLSERRVSSVRQQLIDHGIAASRISISPRGEHNPVSSNDTKTGRAQNRRVEISFTED